MPSLDHLETMQLSEQNQAYPDHEKLVAVYKDDEEDLEEKRDTEVRDVCKVACPGRPSHYEQDGREK